MAEGRARMKLNTYTLVNVIDAVMFFTVSLSFLSKILEQEQLIILSIYMHCRN